MGLLGLLSWGCCRGVAVVLVHVPPTPLPPSMPLPFPHPSLASFYSGKVQRGEEVHLVIDPRNQHTRTQAVCVLNKNRVKVRLLAHCVTSLFECGRCFPPPLSHAHNTVCSVSCVHVCVVRDGRRGTSPSSTVIQWLHCWPSKTSTFVRGCDRVSRSGPGRAACNVTFVAGVTLSLASQALQAVVTTFQPLCTDAGFAHLSGRDCAAPLQLVLVLVAVLVLVLVAVLVLVLVLVPVAVMSERCSVTDSRAS